MLVLNRGSWFSLHAGIPVHAGSASFNTTRKSRIRGGPRRVSVNLQVWGSGTLPNLFRFRAHVPGSQRRSALCAVLMSCMLLVPVINMNSWH